MNWLTLVALSAAGASGSVDVEDARSHAPVVAVVAASEDAAAEKKLDGVVIERADGSLLQIKMEGVTMVLRAYDENKEPIALDVDRGTVRLQGASRPQEHYPLVKSDDGMSLTSARPIRPPHVFNAYILFFRGDSSEPVESHQVALP